MFIPAYIIVIVLGTLAASVAVNVILSKTHLTFLGAQQEIFREAALKTRLTLLTLGRQNPPLNLGNRPESSTRVAYFSNEKLQETLKQVANWLDTVDKQIFQVWTVDTHQDDDGNWCTLVYYHNLHKSKNTGWDWNNLERDKTPENIKWTLFNQTSPVCPTCNGQKILLCPGCEGYPEAHNCARCGGKHAIPCPRCNKD